MTGVLCPCCGTELTVKDNGMWSSLLCAKRILIYYYDSNSLVEVTREQWLEGKRLEAERLSKKLGDVR